MSQLFLDTKNTSMTRFINGNALDIEAIKDLVDLFFCEVVVGNSGLWPMMRDVRSGFNLF